MFDSIQQDDDNTKINKKEFAALLATLDAADGTTDGKISADAMNYVKSAGGAAGSSLPLREGSKAQTDENGTYVVADAWSNVERDNNCLSRIINNNYDLAAMGIKLYSPEYYELEEMVKNANQDIWGNGRSLHTGDKVYLPGLGEIEFEGFEIQNPEGFEVPQTPQNGVVEHDNGDGTITVTRYANGEVKSVATKDENGIIIDPSTTPANEASDQTDRKTDKTLNGSAYYEVESGFDSSNLPQKTYKYYNEDGELVGTEVFDYRSAPVSKTLYGIDCGDGTTKDQTYIYDSSNPSLYTLKEVYYDSNGNKFNPSPEIDPDFAKAADIENLPGNITPTVVDIINNPTAKWTLTQTEDGKNNYIAFTNYMNSLTPEERTQVLTTVSDINPQLAYTYLTTTNYGEGINGINLGSSTDPEYRDIINTVSADLDTLIDNPSAAASYMQQMEAIWDNLDSQFHFANEYSFAETLAIYDVNTDFNFENTVEALYNHSTPEEIAFMNENGIPLLDIVNIYSRVAPDVADELYTSVFKNSIIGDNEYLDSSKLGLDSNTMQIYRNKLANEYNNDIKKVLDGINNNEIDDKEALFYFAELSDGDPDKLIDLLADNGRDYKDATTLGYIKTLTDFYTTNTFDLTPQAVSAGYQNQDVPDSIAGNQSLVGVYNEISNILNTTKYNFTESEMAAFNARLNGVTLDERFALYDAIEDKFGPDVAKELFNAYKAEHTVQKGWSARGYSGTYEEDHSFEYTKDEIAGYDIERQAEIMNQYIRYSGRTIKDKTYIDYALSLYEKATPEEIESLRTNNSFDPQIIFQAIQEQYSKKDETTRVNKLMTALETAHKDEKYTPNGHDLFTTYPDNPPNIGDLLSKYKANSGSYSKEEMRAFLLQKYGGIDGVVTKFREIHKDYNNDTEYQLALVLADIFC